MIFPHGSKKNCPSQLSQELVFLRYESWMEKKKERETKYSGKYMDLISVL